MSRRVITPARLAALRFAENDLVLLVRKRGTIGSIDTRDEVRTDTARWLLDNGYFELDISHGDDAADGYRLSEKGRLALGEVR